MGDYIKMSNHMLGGQAMVIGSSVQILYIVIMKYYIEFDSYLYQKGEHLLLRKTIWPAKAMERPGMKVLSFILFSVASRLSPYNLLAYRCMSGLLCMYMCLVDLNHLQSTYQKGLFHWYVYLFGH